MKAVQHVQKEEAGRRASYFPRESRDCEGRAVRGHGHDKCKEGDAKPAPRSPLPLCTSQNLSIRKSELTGVLELGGAVALEGLQGLVGREDLANHHRGNGEVVALLLEQNLHACRTPPESIYFGAEDRNHRCGDEAR